MINQSQITSYRQLSMPYLRMLAAVAVIGISLYAAVFFLGQGATGIEFYIIVALCIVMEIVKTLFSGDVGFYIALKMPEKALGKIVVLLILFVFSVLSETYLFMAGNLEAQAKLTHVSTVSDTLQQQVIAKQAELAKCNPTHLTKCVNPRTAELSALQAQLNTSVSAGGTSTGYKAIAFQQFWATIGQAAGAQPEALKLSRYIVLSGLLELVGFWLLAEFGAYQRHGEYESQQERIINPEPAVSNALQSNSQPLNAPVSNDNSRLIEEQRQTIEQLQAELSNRESHPNDPPH